MLVVESAEILEITSEPTILKTQNFTNSSSHKATFTVKIMETVEDTTSTNWSMSNTITVGQKFTYSVGFLGTGVGGETSFEYSSEFGEGGEKSKSVTVGSEAGIEVELGPNESS